MQVKLALAQWQKKQAVADADLPADVRVARDGLDAQITDLSKVMRVRNVAQAGQKIKAMEDMLDVIDQFLKK